MLLYQFLPCVSLKYQPPSILLLWYLCVCVATIASVILGSIKLYALYACGYYNFCSIVVCVCDYYSL